MHTFIYIVPLIELQSDWIPTKKILSNKEWKIRKN